jgi:hypothetical protein
MESLDFSLLFLLHPHLHEIILLSNFFPRLQVLDNPEIQILRFDFLLLLGCLRHANSLRNLCIYLPSLLLFDSDSILVLLNSCFNCFLHHE